MDSFYIEFLVKILYLLGVIEFIWGLRLLSSPDTARKGNILAGIGMGLAIIAALIDPTIGTNLPNNYILIFAGMIIGGIIGWLAAKKVKMTAMPEMVSIFNGFGGATAILLALAELIYFYKGDHMTSGQLGISIATLLIGSVTFSGSMLAFGKLNGSVKDKHVTLPGHSYINLVFLAILLGMGIYMFIQGSTAGITLAIVYTVLALIYGISFVGPIGGADMPVVISLLNSFSGISAAAAGFIVNSQVMIVGGILVGAAGTILTILMCDAMNRSLLNVLIGGFGGSSAAAKGAVGDQIAKEVTINDMAINMFYAQNVMFVPGYGLAVAQAQKVVKEVDDILTKNGVNVSYGIHPVAGRMPGHMNVLLAEADVPYPKLLDLEDANARMSDQDVVVIVGANDVVNPAAENDPGSPIYGMPVLQVWKAKNTIVLKRSMSPGYAGIQNQLFFNDNNRMLFGDAKDSLQKLVSELKDM